MRDGGEQSLVVIDAREIGEPLELLEVRRWQLEVDDEPQGRPPKGGRYRSHLSAESIRLRMERDRTVSPPPSARRGAAAATYRFKTRVFVSKAPAVSGRLFAQVGHDFIATARQFGGPFAHARVTSWFQTHRHATRLLRHGANLAGTGAATTDDRQAIGVSTMPRSMHRGGVELRAAVRAHHRPVAVTM